MREGYIVKPEIKWWQEARIILAHQLEILDLDHQLYVPHEFIFGHFKERNGIYQLDKIYFQQERAQLEKYQQLLEEQKLKIVKSCKITDSDYEDLAKHGQAHVQAVSYLCLITNSLQQQGLLTTPKKEI